MVPVHSMADLLGVAAARFGTSAAVVAGPQHASFRELDEQAGRFADAILSLGLMPGDRVTLWAPNSIEWAVVYYGTLRAGAVINPLNALLTSDEVAYATKDCGARLLVAGAGQADAAGALLETGEIEQVVTIGGSGGSAVHALGELLQQAVPQPLPTVAPADSAAILYTSGTTGRPKGAMLSHRSLLLNAALTAQMHLRVRGDVVVSALPLPHVYGAVVLNSAMLVGATVVTHARFDPGEVLASIATHRATMFEGVPTMYHHLLACPRLGHCDTSSLTRCTVGGQAMPVAKMEEVERRLGCPLIELWGMTELGGVGVTHASYVGRRPGSIGVPLPHLEARIAALDAEMPDPPRGTPGELCVRGPLVMEGYFGRHEATAEAVDRDGWLHTGDVARQDDQGYLHVLDRKNDLILVAGYNVYPAELERVIAMHPAVAMVAVGAVPDEAKGEVPKAYVVLRTGVAASVESLLAHCRQHLAPYKLPRQLQFVASLPTTSTGKIQRRALRSLDAPSDTANHGV